MDLLIFSIVMAVLALIYSLLVSLKILRIPISNKKVLEINVAIKEGANAYLKSEYKIVSIYAIVMAIVLWLLISPWVSLAFLIGAVLSASAGYFGMKIATNSNARTSEAAEKSLNKALRIAFSSGSVMGMSVVGLGLLGLVLVFLLLKNFNGINGALNFIVGFGFGASSIALFARVSGGIYTKGADVGADLVGKVEEGIPEDDPRNPGVIADQVGDNVGDVAGMGADLFESYVGSIISAMILGYLVMGMNGIYVSLAIAGIGILSSLIGTFFIRTGEQVEIRKLLWALRKGVFSSAILVVIFTYLLSRYFPNGMNIFLSVVSGLVAGVIIGYSTEYFTSQSYGQTKFIAHSSLSGPGTVIISGISVGMLSTVIPVIVVSAAILSSYHFSGLFGIALAAIGMLSTLGITLSTDAYGPVADNAGGIAEMSGLPESTRERTDALDAIGNTTAATGKGFAIGSAALTALALISAYIKSMGMDTSSLTVASPIVIVGLFLGAMLPFLFSSMTMRAVGRTAEKIVEEVRRQFKELKLLSGRGKPDYSRCVEISTNHALKEMILPGLLAIASPLLVGFLLGPQALGGMLIGATASGFLLAVFMANAGGAWDNAKKYIESGNLGGKGSDAHKAAVVGDTVGDPFKDTSGPSLNILIKLMAMISLVFVPLLMALS
ncbi:MAG: sodium-translocating pyrophosphatase [Candidatus Aenigmarchaeota archaeon]|nr:sodium-translocating pyrophosphatase [Candidatus Aenigmarchaeota archaeon]